MNENNSENSSLGFLESLLILEILASENVIYLSLFGFRESMATFDQLCQTFPDENCVLSSRDNLEEVSINHQIC